ncbi:CTP synthase [Candidatus Uhrbacteria bacterium]|nr:CTP synthase [Candidatus Uhrbacteria bacterium]
MPKFIFVVGGVMSGVGKGTSTASIGKLLESKGYHVTAVKIDPYVNVDAGTMNPIEHGEVFVTDDGDETDQDIGSYERYLDTTIYKDNYMTTGRVYQTVIERERALGYNGRCVQVVPHIPEEVIRRLQNAAKKAKADIVMVEVGGTVGEYENILFMEAARMMKLKRPKDVLFILVSYLPIPGRLGEMKTKPTQHAARTLNSVGVQADFLVARSERAIDEARKRKMSVFCNMAPEDIISSPDVESVYRVPMIYDEQKVAEKILKKFGLRVKKNTLSNWKKWADSITTLDRPVNIAVIGKYFETGDYILSDVYFSVIESLKHASWANGRKPVLTWLNSEEYERDPKKVRELSKYDGVVVPGGFGSRGVEGKITAIRYVREQNIPYFGLCYGMQLAVIEFARNVLGIADAHTAEVNPKTSNPIIHIMPGQEKNIASNRYGGTMRLGAYPCVLTRGTKVAKAYGVKEISERHRHRYEVNNDYRQQLEGAGLLIAGLSPDKRLVEIVELKDHPFFVGTQFHPEFKTRPMKPHPLFNAFIAAAIKARE